MEIKLESYLKNLRALLLEMGGSVEKSIGLVLKGFETPHGFDLDAVLAEEQKINDIHMQIDLHCFKLLARQAPKAMDLRIILAVMKVNSDLERMGDLSRNIGLEIKDILKAKTPLAQTELLAMGQAVRAMVRDALDAVTRDDEQKAKEVLKADHAVDKMKLDLQRLILDLMKRDVNLVDMGLEHILIARHLERISDHATNIAEDVIFIRSGKDIRHGHTDEE